MGKRPSQADRPASSTAIKRSRLTALLERAGKYLPDFSYAQDSHSIESAIKIAEQIVAERKLDKLYVGEGAVYFKDPLIIPEALVTHTKADRASIIASILFASVRPVDGDEGNYLEAFDKAVEFAKKLLPKEAYVDLPLILKNALEIRALDIPVIARPMQSIADLLMPPEGKEAENNENFRQMIVGATQYKRALNIRLHQQLTKLAARYASDLSKKTPAQREELLKDLYATIHYYIPLAEKLGQQKLKQALEDHVLRLADPVMHAKLHDYLGEYERQINLKPDQQNSGKFSVVPALCKQIETLLNNNRPGAPVKVYGRRKTAYATWRKMHKKGIAFEDLDKHIFDFVGITAEYDLAIYAADKAAYKSENIRIGFNLFNIVNQKGKAMFKIIKQPLKKGADPTTTPDAEMVELRNYITNPKRNRYSAIHVRLQCLFGLAGVVSQSMPIIDLHIVSTQDQYRNNYGTASHEAYKTSGGKSDTAAMETKWGNAAEEVIVSTPAGDYIRLKKKYGTVIHMAQAIHNGLAAMAVSAFIKPKSPFKIHLSRIAALEEPVSNGDEVEIRKGDATLLFDDDHREKVLKLLGPADGPNRFVARMNHYYHQLDDVSGLKL